MMRNPRRCKPAGTEPPALLASREAPTTAIVLAPCRISCAVFAISLSKLFRTVNIPAPPSLLTIRRTYQRDYRFRAAIHVGAREAQHAVTRLDQRVLPPVVTDQPVAMIASVELDHEMRGGVVEIGATDEIAFAVVEVGLHLGHRQPCLDQDPTQAGLHRRLSRSGELDEELEAPHATAALGLVCV